jgi:hypothetical protein
VERAFGQLHAGLALVLVQVAQMGPGEAAARLEGIAEAA